MLFLAILIDNYQEKSKCKITVSEEELNNEDKNYFTTFKKSISNLFDKINDNCQRRGK